MFSVTQSWGKSYVFQYLNLWLDRSEKSKISNILDMQIGLWQSELKAMVNPKYTIQIVFSFHTLKNTHSLLLNMVQ